MLLDISAVFIVIIYSLTLGFHVLALLASWTRWYHVKLSLPAGVSEWPSVSIIKPLCGLDSHLRENLETFFTLEYPGPWELLICIEDSQDPAVNVVHSLMEKYPKVDAKLFGKGAGLSEETSNIINPMVRNSVQGYENAKYDFIWMSSARARGGSEMLRDMVARASGPKVGLVHQIPYIWSPNKDNVNSLGRCVERLHFATVPARASLALWLMRINCVAGMSFVSQRVVMERVGGLRSCGPFLAEDIKLSSVLHELGYHLEVAAIPGLQNHADSSLKTFKDRLVRWHRLRISFIPFVAVFLEPFQYTPISGTSACWALHYLFNVEPIYFLMTHTITWLFSDAALFHAGHRNMNSQRCRGLLVSLLKFLIAWVILQFLPLYVTFESILGYPYVKWGKNMFKLSKGTLAEIAN